jgi:pepF/M3 family oligoendopeptidase
MSQTVPLPHWQLTSIFPGLDSLEFEAAKTELKARVAALSEIMDARKVGAQEYVPVDPETVALFGDLVERFNDLYTRLGTIYPYLSGFTSTDAFNDRAQAETSALAPLGSKLSFLGVRLTAWVGAMDAEALIEASEVAAAHAYFVRRSREEAQHLMGDEAEELLSALNPSSGRAWAKLHSDLISRSTIKKTLPGKGEAEYPLTELRNLQSDADPELRRAAYDAELELLNQNAVPFAAAMNSIKAQVNETTLRRGYASALDEALFSSHITRESLEAMQTACRKRFPVFRRYLKAKAKFLGKDTLAWYDLLAPVSVGTPRSFSWAETAAFVSETFGSYSEGLAAFARRTFDEGWHDVPPRKGKRNGAFCMSVRGVRESRIMHNFGGQLDDVFTVAHELGHAYHNSRLYDAARTPLQSGTPMTLAETASIFCETIVVNAMLERADEAEKLAILEQDLLGSTQLVVDIDSRFRFEQGVFEKRRERELSIDELGALMLEAQSQTYGDALEQGARHPLMWAQKGHYYSTGRSFYNYPYTFGYLFGLGLYARYQTDPEGWHERYDTLLSETGMNDAAPLAAQFGIDIESVDFWRGSLAIAEGRVAEYEALVERFTL